MCTRKRKKKKLRVFVLFLSFQEKLSLTANILHPKIQEFKDINSKNEPIETKTVQFFLKAEVIDSSGNICIVMERCKIVKCVVRQKLFSEFEDKKIIKKECRETVTHV